MGSLGGRGLVWRTMTCRPPGLWRRQRENEHGREQHDHGHDDLDIPFPAMTIRQAKSHLAAGGLPMAYLESHRNNLGSTMCDAEMRRGTARRRPEVLAVDARPIPHRRPPSPFPSPCSIHRPRRLLVARRLFAPRCCALPRRAGGANPRAEPSQHQPFDS